MVTIRTEAAPGSGGAISFPASIELPAGLIGFPELTRFDLLPAEARGPFFWLRAQTSGSAGSGFLLFKPKGWLEGYLLELFDEDAEWLALEQETDCYVFNIVTLAPGEPNRATVNLLGPLVVRRRDGVGKQVILANHQRYSATHPLVPDPVS